jgi:1,4-dihydroxy-2-naphthoate octaprenyltransferase
MYSCIKIGGEIMLKKFLKLVEIQTKIASVIPLLLGTVIALYVYDSFDWVNFIIMLTSLLSIDMMVTALNNYMDFKRALKREGYGFEEHNAMGKYGLNERKVLTMIIVLFVIATVLGLFLVIRTDLIVLFLGIASFLVGIFYSWGPLPISRTPLGEVFSGFFMGFIIVFLSIYIHIFDMNIVGFGFDEFVLTVHLDLYQMVLIFLLALPTMSAIANIMLANNICDLEEDIANKRYTLPFYIGKRKALYVFILFTLISYLSTILLVIFGELHLISLLYLGTIFLVLPNMKKFLAKQVKSKTFEIAIQNFVFQSMSYIILIAISLFFK